MLNKSLKTQKAHHVMNVLIANTKATQSPQASDTIIYSTCILIAGWPKLTAAARLVPKAPTRARDVTEDSLSEKKDSPSQLSVGIATEITCRRYRNALSTHWLPK